MNYLEQLLKILSKFKHNMTRGKNLDKIVNLGGPAIYNGRLYFACELKPCDWVIWDHTDQLWIENDEHFIERIKEDIK